MAPHPGIDTDRLREKARKDFLDLLEGVPGRKNLVIEKALAGPIGIFLRFSVLQEHGVDKVFLLEHANCDTSQKNVIFVASGEKSPAPIAIAEQIQRLQSDSNLEHHFSVFWVPRRTLVADKIFEESGVLGDVDINVYPLQFIPLEKDVLSLCLDDSFNDLFLERDPTSLYLAARALMPFQQAHGLFPRIIGKGDYAHRLMELLLRMRSETAAEETSTTTLGPLPSASIDGLIIIDRSVDPATPLMTQLTYEGLIDEEYGIKDNQAELDVSIVGAPPSAKQIGKDQPAQQSSTRKIQLDSSDKLFAQLRDTNFAIVDSLINKVARRLQADIESRHSAKTTGELREFVQKLPGYQSEQASLKTHIGLTEDILKITSSDSFRRILEIQQNLADGTDPSSQHEAIDELMSRSFPLPTILRLVCLESVISGGLRQKDLDSFKRSIMHAYGFQHLLTLQRLEKIGLLSVRASASVLLNPISVGSAVVSASPSSSSTSSTSGVEGRKTNYNYLRKTLRLINDDVDERNPNDISYVYSGYGPLSVRLVQAILQKEELTSLIRGGSGSSNPIDGTNANGTGANGSSRGGHGPGTTGGTLSWQGFDDALRNIRGATFDKAQKGEEQAVKARQMLMTSSGGGGAGTAMATKQTKTVVVMFLGGITFTEIAALRFVGRQMEKAGSARRLLICTTGIVSGETIMKGVIEQEDFGKG